MIEPTPEDIGRKVIYRSSHGSVERGRISSFNDSYVFVLYDDDAFVGALTAKATRRKDLAWDGPGPTITAE